MSLPLIPSNRCEKTSIISTPSADSKKDEFRTPSMFDSSERHSEEKEDEVSIQGLERALGKNSRAQTEVLELFKSFYGESEALSWFKRVKANYPQYSDDHRPIFKTLSDLEHEGRRLQNDLVLAKKRAEYSSMSLEDLTDTVMKMEARLLKAEITLFKQRSNNLAGKHLILVGGSYEISTRCTSIDLDSGEHVQLCELHNARSIPAVVAIGRQVYVAGGMIQRNPDAWTKAFEVYDYDLERWDILPDMPEPLSSITGCSHGSNVIIWGMAGDIKSHTFAVRMYNTSERTWETIPSPPDRSPVNNKFPGLFGYIGNYLYTRNYFFDLDHPNPRWQGKQEQENSKIHDSLHFLLEKISVKDPRSILSNGTELAIPPGAEMGGMFGDRTANFWICNSKTGLFSALQVDWGKKMIAFANNVAVFPMGHVILVILVLSTQAHKTVANIGGNHGGDSSAAIVDLKIGDSNNDKSGEDSPS